MLFTRPLPEGDRARLDALHARLQTERRTFVGYPCNQAEEFGEVARFLEFTLNNVGDPFAGRSYIRQNTHEFEREVVQEFGRMTRAPEGEYWGYVTNGGTEGNMYGLYLARELLPDGVVYFSEDTHYSVAKILRLLHARNIMIKSQRNGELDYQDLKETLRLHRDVPPLLFANIGTTMKGAVDDLRRLREILEDLAIQRYYIHCDAALSGLILPFVPDPQPFDFADGAHSISISGHKLIGAPLPCGVALALRRNVERVARSVEYVGILDTTLSGSRNALSPLMLWYALRRAGPDGFRRCAETCLARADYAVARFAARGIAAWRNRNSITVVFPRPGDAVFRKWQVAPYRDVGHLITMPHVTEALIDEFVEDVAAHPREPAGTRREVPAPPAASAAASPP
ncbi:MAG: histidine decarboxylase [Verrucomicrobiales bacterium]|nr:histidine decarboxylase [Verrucomicrobiales bacterium]